MHKKTNLVRPRLLKCKKYNTNRRIPAEQGMRRLAFDSLVLIRFI